ncbi:thiamine biogenesis protein ThiJ [Salmonella enterica subsp. enterica]|nr:thiamine biogenesis protein ThiJ [Salmonella enterica subsp. enterica]
MIFLWLRTGTLSERQQALFDAVVLPGGPQGSANLAANPAVIAFVARHDAAGKLICPICSAGGKGAGCSRIAEGASLCLFRRSVESGSGRCLCGCARGLEDGNLISGKGVGSCL